eukprot:2846069-Prymnesium_polylepis.1
MFPFTPFIKCALEAGAHGAFLSGAGPTILAIAGGVGIADPGSDTMSQVPPPPPPAEGTPPPTLEPRSSPTMSQACPR